MKAAFLSILVLALTLTSCGKPTEIAYSKLAYNGAVFTDPDTKKPFTGIAREAFKNGHPSKEWPMKNGKLHGVAREWYANGNKLSETEFQDGERCGKNTEWTEAGLLYQERVYDHDHIVSEKRANTGK